MDIKDYIHFYSGQQYIRELHRVDGNINVVGPYKLLGKDCDDVNKFSKEIYPETEKAIDKPILRKIESMTEEEMLECGNLDYDFSGDPELNQWSPFNFDCLLTPNQFAWMLKRGFDLWDLIDAGLAIDAAILSPTKKE